MRKSYKYFLIPIEILLTISAYPAFSMSEEQETERERAFKTRFIEEQKKVEKINKKIDDRLKINIKKKNTKK